MSGSSTTSTAGDQPDIVVLQREASLLRMVLATFVAILPSIGGGCAMAFTSTAAVQYRTENATSLWEPLNEDQSSWFVSISTIAMMTGILSSGFISDRFGIKLCLIFSCGVQMLGWVMVYLSPTFLVLIAGRFITGVGGGICNPASYIILSEIALIKFRGLLSTVNTLTINLAFLFSFILGATVPFEYMIPLSSAPLIVFFIFCWKWLQESPSWCVKKMRIEAASKSLMNIRGPNYKVETELDELQDIVLSQQDSMTLKEKMNYMTSRAVQMPLGIMLVMFTFQATCGADTITYYSLDIFTASKVRLSPYILAILVQSAFTLGYAFSTPLLSRMLRKKQFMLSGCIMVTSYFVLGISLYVKNQLDEESMGSKIFGFLAPASVVTSALGYGMGYGPILYSLVGEIMPQRVKGICCSLCLALRFCLISLQLKIFPTLVGVLGLPIVFWLHSFICLGGTVFAFIFLPETQGKTLTELANLYVKKPELSKMAPPPLQMTKEQEAAMA